MSTKTDLTIIGGGPAGLAAALFFARLKRPAVVYDSKLYRNATTTSSHTIPGFDGADPMAYKAKVRREIQEGYPWITFKDVRVVDVKRPQDSQLHMESAQGEERFAVLDEAGETVLSRKVILATGIQDNLPAIPGLQEAWGKRAIHCIFCDGTETASSPIGFLITPASAPFNPMVIESALKMWPSPDHPATYILTHGLDPSKPEELALSGLKPHLGVVKKRSIPIIPDPIGAFETTHDGLVVRFDSKRDPLTLGHIVVLPESWSPNPHARSFLKESLLGAELSPMGTIAPVRLKDGEMGVPAMPPRMGDDPRTEVSGLFWAGNAGSFMGNVNVSVAQGQAAASCAAEELGKEDLAELMVE